MPENETSNDFTRSRSYEVEFDVDEGKTTEKEGSNSYMDIESSHCWSSNPGESEVEQIAERIESRRENRIPITYNARLRFLKDCRRIAKNKQYRLAQICTQDLQEYRNKVAKEVEEHKGIYNYPIFKYFGILNDVECLLEVLDRAVEVMKDSDLDDNWFFYPDFSYYNTRVVSRFPWMRSSILLAALILLCFYLCTPILFCHVMNQSTICTDEDTMLSGWVSALYFASTTLSTVGYGDLTVSQDPRWRSFVGSMYMLAAMIVAVLAFSAAADIVVSPLEAVFDKVFDRLLGEKNDPDQFLYRRMRRVKIVRISEIVIQIFTFILVGVFASQIAVAFETDSKAQWTWMTSFYWAVQTTTTIGYGDLTQPVGLRWFKIFYLMFSTYLVGNSLGKLGALKEELSEVRRRHAWDRRKVTRRFVDELQAYDHDDKVDQYEFLVASLISLGKLSLEEDIRPIMDKFRNLAGDKGYISFVDDVHEETIDDTNTERMSEDEIDHEE